MTDTDQLAERLEWRASAINLLTANLVTDDQKQDVLETFTHSLHMAHREGIEDAIDILERVAAKAADRHKAGLTVVAKNLRDLIRINDKSHEENPL